MHVFSSPACGSVKRHPQLVKLVDSAASFVWMADIDDVITYLSRDIPAFIVESFAVGLHSWRQFIHCDDQARVERIFRSAKEDRNEYQVDYRLVKTDGSVRWVTTFGAPRFSGGGEFLGYCGTVIDVMSRYGYLEPAPNSDVKYRLLNENSSDLISQHAPDSGIYLYASASFKRILGYEPGDLIGVASVYDHVHPGDESVIRDEILRQFTFGEESRLIEIRVRHKDGRYVWLGTNVRLVTDPATGQKSCSVAVSRDITAEKAARDELRKREEQFRHLTTISSDWYWETDELDRFTFLPDGLQRPSRKSAGELIGKTRRDLAIDPEQPELLECFAKVARHEPFRNILYAVKGAMPEKIRHVNISGAPVFEGGVFRGYRGVARDVTEEIENAKTLARLADENKSIIENSPDIMSVIDRQGRFLRVNAAVSDIIGYPTEQIIGLHYSDLIHVDDRPAVIDMLSTASRHGTAVREFECRWLHKAGSVVYLSTAVRWSDSSGLTYLTARDITERYCARAELQQSRDLISSMLERIGDAFFAIDREWRITYANTRAANSVGTTPPDVIGRSLWEVVPDMRHSSTRPYYERAMQTGEPIFFEIYSTLVHEWLEIRVFPNEAGLTVSFRDITARRDAELALRTSEQRLRDIIQLTPAGYILSDESASIIDVNPALCRIAGYEREELVGENLEKLFASFPWHGALAIQNGPVYADAMEAMVRHKDGHEVPVLFSGRINRNVHGHALSFTAFLTDITRRKQAESRMEHLATHDTLTGLPNRAFLNVRVQSMLEDVSPDRDLAVLFIDLDRFKEVNDSFGHESGDSLLREVARRLRRNLRSDDVVARLGGDEFVVATWCPAGRESASAIAEKLLAVVEEPVMIADHEVYVTAAIGISMSSEDAGTKELLFQNADTAMYRAKAAKRNCYRFFDPGMSIEVKTRMTLAGALRHALDRGEFEIHYQPRIDLKTMSICAMEALLRWNHPELCLVSPMDFIPIAEETGLIEQIGKWVLQEACMQTTRLMREFGKPLRVSVNLSARQLQSDAIVEEVRSVLERTGLAADLLELELTESMLVEDIEHSAALLKDLKRLGIQLSVDDFGTGYSGFAYLRRFPLDVLKLDRSFVIQQDDGISNYEFIKAFVDMAHALKLTVVGEGIETPEIRELLIDAGCDEGQGFLFARPMPLAELEKFLAVSV